LLFVAVGSLWISEMGIQNDEALFSAGIYPPFGPSPQFFGHQYPMMVMTYVGALKAFVYRPIFRVWSPSAASVRIPAILLGTVTIWLFYVLVKRTLDAKTALFATALLATDSSFLLTTRWDWGPVVLQHLCMVGGILALVRFVQMGSLLSLFLGFFAFGLGVWDKAIFAWSLVGLGVAVLAVFPKKTAALLSWTHVAIAGVGLVLGAAPLIHYNLKYDSITFRQNAAWSRDILGYKAGLLLSTLDGNALFGGVTREDWEQPVRQPDDPLKSALVRTSLALGSPRKNWQPYLFLLAVFLLPFVWRTPARPAFLFCAVYVAITWIQMAFTQNAGTGVHHPVLMWPMPHLGMAAVVTEASRKFGRAGMAILVSMGALVCGVNLAVTSTYYTNMLRNGGVKEWTDAIYPASAALPEMNPSHVCVLDWGFFEPIRLLHRGRLPLCAGVEPEAEPEIFRRQLDLPNTLFIRHVEKQDVEAGRADRFVKAAEQAGYTQTSERVFYDYNGRPMIEIFKLFKPQRP
jgi:4-amino-4-deoxy-L-arabinose transferase-like glycosyltransferase